MNRFAYQPARGFTLVELLVVVGIIVLLVGIVTPIGLRAYRNSEVTRVKMDLQTIAAALEAYKQDHGDYPRIGDYTDPAVDGEHRGARLLAWALIGPFEGSLDGADGPGFRTRRIGTTAQGRVYGPYLTPDSFPIGTDPTNADSGIVDPAVAPMLFDKTKKPILYFAARGNKSNLVGNAMTPPFPYYNYADNTAVAADQARFAAMLSDGTNPRTTVPYLLWAAGLDAEFGPAGTSAQHVDACDDITNFMD